MTDLAVLLARYGYRAIERDRAARGGGATYASRLLGRRTVVIGEPAGARAFYDESLARRAGAVPRPLAGLLFGRGAVHGTDGAEHRDRKLLFLDVLGPPQVDTLVDEVCRELVSASRSWNGREVSLHRVLTGVLGRAVLRWAGIELSRSEADAVSARLAQVVDGFGLAPTAYARAWRARRWADEWATGLVADVRAGRSHPPKDSALRAFADAGLDDRTAGVELLNVMRPTVAVSWLGCFVALALAHSTEEERARLGNPSAVQQRYAFAQEVRRTSPFAPALAARAVRAGEVSGVRVRRGDRLLLDVVGIDHHEETWPRPHEFRGDRLLEEDAAHPPLAFDLVPQGGGHPSGHRCPGEPLTLRLLAEMIRVLAPWTIELRDETVDATRIPTLPRGVSEVRFSRPPVQWPRGSRPPRPRSARTPDRVGSP